MKFIQFFVDRPITASVVYLILALGGAVAWMGMPVDLMPGGDAGVLTVFVGVRGGLPPEDIESMITKPVEDAMASLPNLESITSVSRKERAVITINFKPGTDSSRASLEVQERLAKIKGKLPKEIEKPVVSRYDENQAPVVILAMSSKYYTPEEMREVADNQLKPLLKRVNGVANIEIGGGRERKILVEFDLNRLAAYGIPIRQVIGKIGQENLNILSGKADRERDSYLIRTVGAFKTIEELAELPIMVTKEGSRIRLKDMAVIKDYYLEAQSYSRMNQEPVVSIYIQKEALANTITTSKGVKRIFEEFKKTLDPRITFSVVTDRSVAIEKALENVWGSLMEGSILSGLILIIFLKDLLLSVFIFVSIPLSLIITIAIMQALGMTLNVMTISGLAIACGMIVDDSIVVLENIVTHQSRLGHALNRLKLGGGSGVSSHPKTVKMEDIPVPETPADITSTLVSMPEKFRAKLLPAYSTNEMILALVSSTLTSVIVFLPIVFMNPQVRMMYTGLAITVSSCLLLSLLISCTVIPSLAANVSEAWMKESSFFSSYMWLYVDVVVSKTQRSIGRQIPKAIRIWRKVSRTVREKVFRKEAAPSDMVYSADRYMGIFKSKFSFREYRHVVAILMRRRYWMLFVIMVSLLVCARIYKTLDKEFVGSSEENEFIIFVELPSGAKLDVSDKIVAKVEKVLNETPDIQKTMKTAVARVEGWSSKIYVTLAPREERVRTATEIIAQIRPLVSQIGQEYSAFIYFSEPVSSKEFLIDVFGYDYNKLRDICAQIAKHMGGIKGLLDVKLRYKPGQPEVRIEIERDKASMFGFGVNDIAETLHAQIRGMRATYFMTPTAQIEAVARLQEPYRKTLDDVKNLSIINNRGVVVPIQQLAKFEFGLTSSEIWRKGRERMIQVSANRGDLSLGKVADQAKVLLKRVQMPTGYYYEFGGDFPKMVETEKESMLSFIMMVLLVYALLATTFSSYLQPFVILCAVPMTVIGAIPLLWITKTPVTLGAMIGMVMLGGIAVKNSIILIDVFNGIRIHHHTHRALIQAGQERIRPIVMTSLTAILGLIPLILRSDKSDTLWRPMAMTVVGGLTVSTVLVLFLIPGFYLIMKDLTGWIARKMHLSGQPDL